MTTRSQHAITKPNPKYSSQHYHATTYSFLSIPKYPIISLNDPNWKNSMKEECNALIENKTWDLVAPSTNIDIIMFSMESAL